VNRGFGFSSAVVKAAQNPLHGLLCKCLNIRGHKISGLAAHKQKIPAQLNPNKKDDPDTAAEVDGSTLQTGPKGTPQKIPAIYGRPAPTATLV
jgi:hypothetical protein